MAGFKEFLQDCLMTEPQWRDAGQGRYVKRRRWKGSAKVAGGTLLAMFLAAGVGYTLDFFHWGASEKPEPAAPASQPLASEPDVVRDAREAGVDLEPENTVEVTVTPAPEPTSAPEPAPAPRPTPAGGQNNYWVKVNKGDYTLTLYQGDDVVKTYSVAVGENPGNKQRVGDHRTPEGNFRVVSIENASRWKHDFHDGKGPVAGAYGPWFIRLDAGGWKGIGIHGTHDPDSRGTMASEGCVRMANEDVQELRTYAYRNMRVVIEP